VTIMLKLLWSHRYKNYTVVITIWLTDMKYPYLNWQWIFYFLRRFFSFLYHYQDLYRSWLYIWVARRVSYKKQKLLIPFASTWVHPRFLLGSVLLFFLMFCIVFCFVLFVFVLCLVYPMLPVSLLIAPSGFSNVYA